MRAGALLGLRAAVAVAFVATAALAVTLSRGGPSDLALASAKPAGAHATASAPAAGTHPAGTNTAGAAPSARAPSCAASRLRISLGPGAVVPAGVTRYALDFTNVSAAPCTLAGYPQVAAYQGDGVQVGDAAVQDTSVAAVRVLLGPGQTAHAALDATPLARCHPVHAAGLRVVLPPGQTGARYVRRTLTACATREARGQEYLRVRAIQAGPGLA
jgi:hypothetical protein